jgi:hypothetical protein
VLGEVLQRLHLPQDQYREAKDAATLAEAVWNLATATSSAYVLSPPPGLQQLTCFAAHSPERRAKHLSTAKSLLATLSGPCASYHRALVLSLEGPTQRPDAISAARAAVEGAPREVRGWHLLGLLLAADGDYNAAREILEIGATPENEDSSATEPIDTSTLDVLDGWNEDWTGWPQEEQEDWAKRDEREDALQLRMTQVAIIEAILGPEGASKRWLEVFTWWSRKFGFRFVTAY